MQLQETIHETYTRMTLPEEMKGICSVSFSLQEKLVLVNTHLKTIFGEMADWKKNLELYYHDSPFCDNCCVVETLENLKELTFEDILSWIEEERNYSVAIKQMQELLSSASIGNTPEEVKASFAIATILGLMDGKEGRIYSYYVNWKGITESEEADVHKRLKNNSGLLSIIVRLLGQLMTDGLQVTYPVLNTVMTQQKQKYYYRGENAFYGSSRPSGFRPVKNQSRILTLRLNDLRKNEGGHFLNNFEAVVNWPNSAVNHIALLQHYGLKTQMMDVTSDIMAALFFATCCYEDGKWRPLRADEIENANSRPYIHEMGGDSRYAVLFRKLSEITDIEWALLKDDNISGYIFPVGYQPFMRCASQHAYGILTLDDNYNLYRDRQFEKYKIRLTEELCQWVFNQSDEGRNIYPNNDILDISKYFNEINRTRYFSCSNFMEIMDGKPKEEIRRVQHELEKCGYHISRDEVKFISKKDAKRINDEYPLERAMTLTGLKPMASPLIVI